MSQNHISGSCNCHAVTFSITSVLPDFYQCYCSTCRKLSGSSSDTATFVDSDNFTWLSGQDKITHFKLPSGYCTDFCSVCGSTVPHPMQNGAQMWVPAGLLDENCKSTVVMELYCQSKAHWVEHSSDIRHYDTMPDIKELNDKLHQHRRDNGADS